MHIANSPEPRQLILELNRLLNLVLAGEAKAALLRYVLHDIPAQQAAEVESEEIFRLLLTIAVNVRVLDDRLERTLRAITGPCGELIPDLRKPTRTEPLTIREACNKIIHATKLQLSIEDNANGEAWFGRRVSLAGESAGRHPALWSATLDLSEFCRETLDAVIHYWQATKD